MRQYEYQDCFEDAQKGKSYEITTFTDIITAYNCCDLVVGFGNPLSKGIVWLPYGSTIKVDEVEYKIVKGKLSKGNRNIRDHSINCLKDQQNQLHSLYYLIGKTVILTELSLVERIKRLF